MYNPKYKDRVSAGDEFYTPKELVKNIIKSYDYIFKEYDYIWLPFNVKGKPILKEMKKKYGDKIILTPDNCYNKTKGFNDFFEFKNDEKFVKFLNENKVLVFDNPPFSYSKKIYRYLKKDNNVLFGAKLEKDLDFIFFADGLTFALTYYNFEYCCHLIGDVSYINNTGLEISKNAVNTCLVSNLFNEIKFNFDASMVCKKKLEWNDKVNINKNKNERKGILTSAVMEGITKRGFVFRPEYIRNTKEWIKKFGGAIFYDFGKHLKNE